MGNWRELSVWQRALWLLGALAVSFLVLVGMRLFFQYSLWSIADSLASELAIYVPMNHGFLRATTLLLFVGLIPLGAIVVSLNRRRWKAGLFVGGITLAAFYAVIGFASTGFKINPISGAPTKCYSLFNGKVIYHELVDGLERQYDPATGRRCNPVTPEVAVKLSLYEHAVVPNRIPDSVEPDMFDRTLGTPLVWYFLADDGTIELFDNEGFHPETSISLLPITPEVARVWRAQRDQRLLAGKKALADQERLERLRREEIAAFEKEKKEQERLAILEQERQKKLSEEYGGDCDRLAGNSFDRHRNPQFPGVSFQLLALSAEMATSACRAAGDANPSVARYQYQLARSHQAVGSQEAKPILRRLVQSNYSAAFDNLGWLLVREGQIPQAVELFRHGADLGSAEAMVSLAGFMSEGKWVRRDDREAMRLLAAAAEQGHPAAREAVDKYEEQRRIGQIGGALIGTIIGEMLRNKLR